MRSTQAPPMHAGLGQRFPLTGPGVLLLSLFLVSTARGQQPADAGVRVQASEGWINLHVTRRTPLSAVLRELCEPTASRCEGVQEIEETIPPLTMQGTWAEVITRLLESTKLNYVVVERTASVPARLVLSRSVLATPTALEFGNARNNATKSDSVAVPRKFQVDTSEPATAMTPFAAVGGAANGPSQQARVPNPPSDTQFQVPSVPSPGFMGGPIIPVVAQPGLPVSVFPDTNGNPAPILPQSPSTVSVFPDTLGRPVPLQTLPPDTKQKIESPFPPELSGPR